MYIWGKGTFLLLSTANWSIPSRLGEKSFFNFVTVSTVFPSSVPLFFSSNISVYVKFRITVLSCAIDNLLLTHKRPYLHDFDLTYRILLWWDLFSSPKDFYCVWGKHPWHTRQKSLLFCTYPILINCYISALVLYPTIFLTNVFMKEVVTLITY